MIQKTTFIIYCNHFAVREAVFLFVCVLMAMPIPKLCAQVNMSDPSFEEDYTYLTTVTDRWIICEGSPDKWIADQFDWMSNPDPTDGIKYLGIATPYSWDTTSYESISHLLPDTLFHNVNYYFDVDIAFLPGLMSGLNLGEYGKVVMYLGNSACDQSQKIAVCITSDTLWERRRVHFTPDADYTSIMLRTQYVDTIGTNYIVIDNFSPIYLDGLSLALTMSSPYIQVSSMPGGKQFTIDIIGFETERFSYSLYKINGQALWRNVPLRTEINTYTTNDLPIGIYVLVVRDMQAGISHSYLVGL